MNRFLLDTLLTKADLDRIDAKNAESNFIDALYDTSREQADIIYHAIINLITSKRDQKIKDILDFSLTTSTRRAGYIQLANELLAELSE